MTTDATPRCATCGHWGEPFKPGYKRQDDGTYRTCTRIEHGGWDVGAETDTRIALAFTQDASDYASHLETRAEFGCVLHEAKERP